jgi:hypothetical protein
VPDRVVWSPDGNRAAIVGDDGLHLCDVAGKLSPVLVPGVKCAAWMPNSQQLVVYSQRVLKTWKEASQAFPDDAAAASKNLEAVRKELLATSKDWSTFMDETAKELKLTREQLALSVMYVRDSSTKTIPLKLDKDGQKAFAEQWILEDLVQVYDVSKTNAVTAGATLYHGDNAGNGIKNLRVSPNGKGVLLSSDVSIPNDHRDPLLLLLVPTDGTQRVCHLGRAGEYADWSPDGEYVVYIRPAGWSPELKEALLGALSRQDVTDANGQFLDQEHLPAREDLAGLLFDPLARVRVAKDGRIFFSAAPVSAPAAVKDFDLQPTVFSFEPGKQSTLTRVVPYSAMQTMGDAAQYFELSPDARYLSIPFGDGRVSVLDIASGEAQVVQPDGKHEGDNPSQLASVPVWRTATELTFVRPTAAWTSHEVVRYSIPDKTAKVISGDWPEAIGLGAK